MTLGNSALFRPGDKFALVAAQSRVDDLGSSAVRLDCDLWVSNTSVVSLSDHWQQWLGSIRCEHLVKSNLVIAAKLKSKTPAVLDDENVNLLDRVKLYWAALLLSARFPCFDAPLLLTDANVDGESDIRQVSELPVPSALAGLLTTKIAQAHLVDATIIANAMTQMVSAKKFRRLYRVIDIYTKARSEVEPLDQIHQYCLMS